jgi:hypothetical protein
MLAFHWMHYNITVDPVYAVEVLNHMWATEPVGTTSILLTGLGLMITLMFKLLDFWWEWYKEHSRQGRLNIELSAEQNRLGQVALCAVISNIGKELIVVRDIGYAKPRLLGTEFIRFVPMDTPLPHALNARDLVRITVSEDETDLVALVNSFRVKDSLGKIWDVPEGEIRKARRQLKVLKATLAQLNSATTQQGIKLEQLQVASPLSTQN